MIITYTGSLQNSTQIMALYSSAQYVILTYEMKILVFSQGCVYGQCPEVSRWYETHQD